MGEDDDEHEVATKNAGEEKLYSCEVTGDFNVYSQQVVDALVGEGQGGGNHAVDADEHPQGPQHLTLLGARPEHFLIHVPEEVQCLAIVLGFDKFGEDLYLLMCN